MPELIALWAQDKEGLIGKNRTIPWHLPADLAHFKATTTGETIVMGRTTFEGMSKRLLPNRTSIIMTHDVSYDAESLDAIVLHSKPEVLAYQTSHECDLYIIGGGKVFESFSDEITRLIVTRIHHSFDGDVYMPDCFDWDLFDKVSERNYPSDTANPYPFTITTYQKRES